MQKSLLLSIILALLFHSVVNSQCATTGFSMADSICSGQSFQISNTSAAGLSYEWDLCPGDLNLIPTGQNLGNVGPLNFPQQIKAIKDNGKYFVFVASYLSGTLLRLDYGTSFNNTPVPYYYGGFGGLLLQPTGLDVVKDNGIWYAIMANNSNKKIIRINLGASIESNIASAIDLGLFNLNNPKNLKIAKDGSNYHVFVTNELSTDLIRIDFGNSIANTPSGFTAVNNALFVSGWGFDVTFDCVQNKYVGFFISYGQNKIQVLDFGNSLLNAPTISQSVSTAVNPSGAQLIRDGINWHLLLSVFGMSQLQNFKIGNNLLNTPVSIFADTVAGIKSPQSITVLEDSSKFFAFTSNTSPASLSRISWANPCTMNPIFSTDTTGVLATSNGGGFYNIALTTTDPLGVQNTFSDSIFISPSPTSFFTATAACDGLPIQFNDSSVISSGTIASWLWDFGDGSPTVSTTNPIYIYATNGTYPVTLTTTSAAGCIDTYTDSITVSPLPTANFGFSNNQCSGVPVNFNDLSLASGGATIVSWLWDFGDSTLTDPAQNPVHVYDSAGTYTINLIVEASTGCIDSINQTITILPSPVSNFFTTSTCIGETVSFSNTTSIQGGGSINYTWDFGDGGSSILINPTHQYLVLAGNYNVNLIATAANGCSDTITQNIRIANKPIPQFNWIPNIVCQGNQVNFTSTSTGTGGDTISNYLWDFGDLTSSILENPNHVYADTGYFDVTLTVVSPTNCDSSITQQVYVIASPSASFTASNVCLNLSSNFNPLVTTPPGTQVDSIVWSFGDGSGFSGLSSPVHSYLAPGRYEVIMTVYNDLLCTGSFMDSVDVYPLPIADFTTTVSCSGSLTGFDGTASTVAGDTLVGWLWNFAGLGTSTDTIAQFNFLNAGIYTVTLISTTIHGCTDTIQKPVTITQSPIFDFTYNEPCFGNASTFTFDNLQTGSPANLEWNFGDGSLSFLLNPSYIYTYVDTFTVTLTVQNPTTLCSSAIQKQLIVKPLPETGFLANNNCEDIPIQFTDTSTVLTGTIISWNWDLGILGTFTSANPIVTPTTPGNYPATLTVTTDQGCFATATNTVTVYEKPTASFSTNPSYGSPPFTLNILNTTTGAVNYLWDFGDGGTGVGITPIHIYPDTGIYNITLIATSIDGCIDSAQSVISVLIPKLDIGVRKIYATQDGSTIKLTAELINAGNVDITEFTLKGLIENNSSISEHWEGLFTPGTILLYTFNASYEVASEFIPSYYCIEALYPNDSQDNNSLNNKKCEVLNNEFELFSAYPNPFDEIINISFNLNTSGNYSVELYDDAGKIATEKRNIDGLQGFNTTTINTITLSKGTYSCIVRFREEIRVLKVVKLK